MTISGKKAALLIVLAGAVPLLAAYLTYRTAAPQRTSNYGSLLEPQPVPAEVLGDVDGHAFDFKQLRGRWVLVFAGPGACDEPCRQRLYYMRQIRTALGKDMGRVERVWLVSDGATPEAELRAAHPGLYVLRDGTSGLAALLRANAANGYGLFLVDPLGNLMLRYPADLEARRVLKDLQHLLRLSRVG